VNGADAFWTLKQQNGTVQERNAKRTYEAIEVPRNNPTGFFLAFFAVLLGFSLIWRIWWGAGLGLLGAIVVCLIQAWRTDREVEVPAEKIAAFERLQGLKERAV
jgi:cytochrome o ubiquinol oxidase subunit 1